MKYDSYVDGLTARILRVLESSESRIDDDTIARIVDGVVDEAASSIPDDIDVRTLKMKLTYCLTSGTGPVYTILHDICACPPGSHECERNCHVGAITRDETGMPAIDAQTCIDCGLCAKVCETGAITAKSACLDLMRILKQASQHPIYAILAPSFVGQFGNGVTPQSFKLALRRLGFSDVIEVALAADVITLHEAHEYIERASSGRNFMITSCCCPAFVKLVEKRRPNLSHLISHSVSPMIACARLLKAREHEARVVFIGPCLAKRAESHQPQLLGAVDLVLTFKELSIILDAAGIDASRDFGISVSDFTEASGDGRIYAFTGGVTEAIKHAVESICPDFTVNGIRGNGLKECSTILSKIEESGYPEANFMEGMACPGGCVGGPGTIIPVEDGEFQVSEFAGKAPTQRAIDNDFAQAWSKAVEGEVDLQVSKRDLEHLAVSGSHRD